MSERFSNLTSREIENIISSETDIGDNLHTGNIFHGIIGDSMYGFTVEFENQRAVNFTFDFAEDGTINNVEAISYIKYSDRFYANSEPIKIDSEEQIGEIMDEVRELNPADTLDYLKLGMDNIAVFNSKYHEFKEFAEGCALSIEDSPNGVFVVFENGNGILISDEKVIPFNFVDDEKIPTWGVYGALKEMGASELLDLAKNLECGNTEMLSNNAFCTAVNPTIEEFIENYNVYEFLSRMGPEGLMLSVPIADSDISGVVGHSSEHLEISKLRSSEDDSFGKEEARLTMHIIINGESYTLDSRIVCEQEMNGIKIETVSHDENLSAFEVLKFVEGKIEEFEKNADMYVSNLIDDGFSINN